MAKKNSSRHLGSVISRCNSVKLRKFDAQAMSSVDLAFVLQELVKVSFRMFSASELALLILYVDVCKSVKRPFNSKITGKQ